ncbi:MAG: cation:proton antiporter [Chlamydiota bacterium]
MAMLLAYALTLLFAVLISGLARRTVLSTAVLFLGAGLLIGSGSISSIPEPNTTLLRRLAELALFSVLFTDGMRTGGMKAIRTNWRAPGRALILGMPLTIAGIAILAYLLVGVTWPAAFLLGAALSPTDPVFVSAIFSVEAVPDRVKRLLNLESGLNDGLALIPVMLLLPEVGTGTVFTKHVLLEMAVGVAIGLAIPWAGIVLERSRFFGAAGIFEPLNAFAIGLLVLAVSYISGANSFLAAFAGGVSVATFSPAVTESFERFGELVTELLKLAALLVLGAVIEPRLFVAIPGREYLFVLLAVFVVRLPAIWLSFLGSHWPRKEIWAVAWFGPKGFASVVYGIFILNLGTPEARHMAHLIALGIAASILVCSSTDILVGRWFHPKRAVDRGEEIAS